MAKAHEKMCVRRSSFTKALPISKRSERRKAEARKEEGNTSRRDESVSSDHQ